MTYMHGQPEQAPWRQIIDVAVGVLIGWRGCSQSEAFAELVEGVRTSSVGLGATAQALVAPASGTTTPPRHRQDAIGGWVHRLVNAPGAGSVIRWGA